MKLPVKSLVDGLRENRLFRHLAAGGVVVLTLAMFPSIVRTVSLVSAPAAIRNAGAEFEAARTPGSGEDVLPPKVRVMIGMLKYFQADSFAYSDAIKANGGMMQRLVEGAYPIRCTPQAPFLLFLEGEPLPVGWKLLAAQEGVALAARP